MKTRAKILQKLGELSYKYPELRLAQIFVNAAWLERNTSCPEIFYLTDDELLDSLEKLEAKYDSL